MADKVARTAGFNRTTAPAGARAAAALAVATAVCLSGCRTADTTAGRPRPAAPSPELVRLAERVDAAVAAVGSSPGREYANRLRSEHRPAWLAYFKGNAPKPKSPGQESVRQDIANLVELVEAGLHWPAPGTYTIPRASEPPQIDGKLDDQAWKHAAAWEGAYPFNKTEPTGQPTAWRMLWDDKYLYFAFDCPDPDIVAPDRKRDDNVYSDDCVEMFILPDFRFRTYWEIVIAPNGSLFDSVECKNMHKWGCNLDPAQDVSGLKHAQTIRGTLNNSDDTDQGYTVEVAVPFAELPGFTRCAPEPGDRLHFMLVRLDRTNGQFKAYAFRPLQGWGHNIWNHAVMVLAEENQ